MSLELISSAKIPRKSLAALVGGTHCLVRQVIVDLQA